MVARSRFGSQNAKKHFILGELLEVEMSKSCPRLRHEAHFEVKMLQAPQVRSTFGRSVVEKVYGIVARSTFRSQTGKNTAGSGPNTSGSEDFWKLSKSARRCGAKSFLKSKVLKTDDLGELSEVEMSQKWTRLWHEADFKSQW